MQLPKRPLRAIALTLGRPERAEGQGLVEYGLILAGVSIAALVALFALGPRITDLFNTVGGSLRAS